MSSQFWVTTGVAVGIPALISLVSWLIPKAKVITWAKIGRVHGRLLSKLGNTKLGKKAMSSIEEGPITTIVAGIMSYVTEFGAGLTEDNSQN